MIKKVLILMVMLIVGWGLGTLYTPQTYKPENEMASDCNYISKYDFYDYEEAVLKEGDMEKLGGIVQECGVDRFPYMIVMYDVYKKDVRTKLLQMYNLYYRNYFRHKSPVMTPLWIFIDDVLFEYDNKGDVYSDIGRLEEFKKYE